MQYLRTHVYSNLELLPWTNELRELIFIFDSHVLNITLELDAFNSRSLAFVGEE